ncbi:arabinosylfuranosidase ArfA [Microbacterium sp.]|uniref:arabinosylfuranosidase ArfA n=1 Tax=Microbacterium sp. TaxID=51671 RepID=UPI003F730491
MATATVVLDRDFTAGHVPRRLFGSFVEHMGRCVYTGIYEPGHARADDRGFRQDVLELVRELGPTVVRYPGGNFVSGYEWEDGVGPVEQRPRRLDGAWHAIETNAFGLHEFVDWSRAAGVEVMEAVNLGTRGVEAARALVEYANHPGGSKWSDLRIANGAKDPFDIRLWCLGNELDGPWQIGHKTPDEYGRLAAEAGKAMKMVDPTIELVAVGSSNSRMPTFGEWEYAVLSHAYEQVDFISCHAYYEEEENDAASFLASALDMDHFISSVVSTADAVRAKRRDKKYVNLSFDEWNVWYERGPETPDKPQIVAASSVWQEHPRLIEDQYNVTDAVVVGTLLHSLLRNGDRVKIANQAQLVNVIAPIRSEPGGPAWRQTIFWPFARIAALARGLILTPAVQSDRYPTSRYGDADVVDVSSTWDQDLGSLSLFLANRGLDEDADVQVLLRGLRAVNVASAEVLTVPKEGDRFSFNSQHAQAAVGMAPLKVEIGDEANSLQVSLPPLSWAVVTVAVQKD